MTNEYGATLDRAGYAPSIMQVNRAGRCSCYLCGRAAGYNKLDRHEPWGAANRRKSMELGLWVLLCHEGCHEGPGSVHADGEKARELRRDAQRAAMLRYGWSREEWIGRFGKSELSEEDAKRLIILPKEGGTDCHVGLRPSRNDRCGGEEPSQSAQSADSSPGVGAKDGGGAGTSSRVAALIRKYWPDHQTTTRASGFCLIDGPDLPF